jgi:outer membrane protein OmpA-like peptidoglycan-associated protein
VEGEEVTMMRNGLFLAALLGGLVVAPSGIEAAQPLAPTETGETGLLTMPTTKTISPWTFSFGTYYRGQVGTDKLLSQTTNQRLKTSVDQWEFAITLGVWDGLELSTQVPYVQFTNDQSGGSNDANKVGDVHLGAKFRLFEEGLSPMPFSLAMSGQALLPTGSQQLPAQLDRNTAMNGDEVGGDVMAIVDKNLFKLPGDVPVTLTANLGGLFPSKPNIFRLDRQTEPVFSQLRRKGFPDVNFHSALVEYGAGLKLPLWVSQVGTLDSTVEYRGNSGTIEEVDAYQAVLVGFRYTLAKGFAAQGGVDFGLSNSVTDYAFLVGVSYSGPQPEPEMPEAGKTRERIVYRDHVIEVETVSFPDVNFEFDRPTLTEVGQARVFLVSQKLKDGKNVKIEIQCRNDYISTEDYEKRLDMARAEAVKSELVRLGVDAARISTVSFGESTRPSEIETPWARAVNRRAEFVVVASPES